MAGFEVIIYGRFCVITEEPMRYIESGCQLLKDWRRAYRRKDTYTLDSRQLCDIMMSWQFKMAQMPPYSKIVS
jgi:hypothetical protein